MDFASLLAGSPEVAAPRILGAHLVSEVGGRLVRARVTEVEAYRGFDDPASHAYRGRTARNGSMFERPGTLYVYRSYGVHWCGNVAAGPEGVGWGILFRAAEIIDGLGVARSRRGRDEGLANGPGKLTQALGITLEDNGSDLAAGPVVIEAPPPGWDAFDVAVGERIGITKAVELPWRFCVAGNRNVSRPWPTSTAAG
jgi:DNA-3-methyladenine glycosylase